jgi:nicotinate-nucleotide pyrophosphorylase (carboxylating)
MESIHPSIVTLVRASLEEDVGPGDVTSLACLEPEMIKARITAKSDGVLSGLVPARIAFEMVDSANQLKLALLDGEKFSKGETILEIEGLNRTVLTAERTALNFMAHLSGVATQASNFVKLVEGTECRLLDTRKTTPGFRVLEKQAVAHGGGHNHRMGLYDMILIKDNHIAAAGSISSAIDRAREYLASGDFRFQFDCEPDTIGLEVEITTPDELAEAIKAGAKRLLLDNQTPEALTALVELARKLNSHVELEASGNVTMANVATIAATGVDYISIGALTHSAKASDFSLRVIDAED